VAPEVEALYAAPQAVDAPLDRMIAALAADSA
jgi:hypothetical protein